MVATAKVGLLAGLSTATATTVAERAAVVMAAAAWRCGRGPVGDGGGGDHCGGDGGGGEGCLKSRIPLGVPQHPRKLRKGTNADVSFPWLPRLRLGMCRISDSHKFEISKFRSFRSPCYTQCTLDAVTQHTKEARHKK